MLKQFTLLFVATPKKALISGLALQDDPVLRDGGTLELTSPGPLPSVGWKMPFTIQHGPVGAALTGSLRSIRIFLNHRIPNASSRKTQAGRDLS